MDAGFFPVKKKAAPTKILGLGFTRLNVMLAGFLGSAGLELLTGAAAGLSAAGLAATLLDGGCAKEVKELIQNLQESWSFTLYVFNPLNSRSCIYIIDNHTTDLRPTGEELSSMEYIKPKVKFIH